MLVSIPSESTLRHHTTIAEAYAQPYVETVKNRNLTIDLGNGLKTNATLTYPAVGKGPFPGVGPNLLAKSSILTPNFSNNPFICSCDGGPTYEGF